METKNEKKPCDIISVDDFAALVMIKEKKENDLASLLIQVKETKKDLIAIDKLLDRCIFEDVPTYLNDTEKIVYYFSNIRKVPARKIYKSLGYAKSTFWNVKSSITKKINKKNKTE